MLLPYQSQQVVLMKFRYYSPVGVLYVRIAADKVIPLVIDIKMR